MLNWRTRKGARAAARARDPRKEEERNRRANSILVRDLAADEARAYHRKIWRQIQGGLLVYYVWTLGGLFVEASWSYGFWVLVAVPAFASFWYFIGAALNYKSAVKEYLRGEGERTLARGPRTGRVVSVAEQIELSRRRREAFHAMHMPDTLEEPEASAEVVDVEKDYRGPLERSRSS